MLSKVIRVVTHAPHLAQPAVLPPAVMAVKPAHTSPLTKAGRLMQALRNWKRAGMHVTPKALRRRRLGPEGCAGCGYWDPKGNLGWGECRGPGCGCTQFKAWMLDQTCPHPDGSRWPAAQPSTFAAVSPGMAGENPGQTPGR